MTEVEAVLLQDLLAIMKALNRLPFRSPELTEAIRASEQMLTHHVIEDERRKKTEHHWRCSL
jgi:hypothetical protein